MDKQLASEMDSTLQKFAQEHGRPLADALRPILIKNAEIGRMQNYLDSAPGSHTLETYLFDTLHHHYQQEQARIEQLYVAQNEAAWLDLLEKVRKWAFSFLRKWNLDPLVRKEFTIEIAQIAAQELLTSDYRYDAPFDGWVCRLTQHCTSKHMRKHDRELILPEEDIRAIDERLRTQQETELRSIEGKEITKETMTDLLAAIEQLPPNQQQTVWDHYVLGLTFDEIAEKEGVTKNTIYKRHFDGLKRLRKILDEMGDKDE